MTTRKVAIICSVIILFFIVVAIFAPLLVSLEAVDPITKVKADLKDEVTKVVTGDGASAKYTFEDCQTLMPNPPSGVPTANPSSEEAPADSSSSSAAQ